MCTRLQSSRLLLCRGNRRFSGYVARQSQRPADRQNFTKVVKTRESCRAEDDDHHATGVKVGERCFGTLWA
jgi:hypothetical protein